MTDIPPSRPDPAPGSPAATLRADVPRALLAAVIVMGVAIVVGVVILVAVVLHRMSAPHPGPHPRSGAPVPVIQSAPADGDPPGAPGVVPASRHVTLPVAPNTHVRAVSARADGTIAIVLSADNGVGDSVVIWDPATGRVGATLRTVQGAP